MKIANKITLLVVLLLAALGANTYIGLTQLRKISWELSEVANKNNSLLLLITGISQNQSEKAVLFERLIRITEELTYEDLSVARKEHLLDSLSIIQRGFEKITQISAASIIKARVIIDDAIDHSVHPSTIADLKQTKEYFAILEKAHIEYDNLIGKIFEMLLVGDYKLGFDDLDRIQVQERKLDKQFRSIHINVQSFTRKSLIKAEYAEIVARNILWNSLFFSIAVSLIVAFLIIRNISTSLKRIESAANQISRGKFVSDLNEQARDEIGEVSKAFNVMSKRLKEAQSELKNKNEELKRNLNLTKQQKRDLEKVNKELDNFVHTVSHDIRSPLMGITGYGSVLESQYKKILDKRGQRCVDGIKKGVTRLNAMITDLLALTQISRIKNPYEQIEITGLINAVLERLEFRIAELNVDLNVQDNMPTIVCDRIKLGEVFLNLISNAIKFSSKNKDENPKVDIGYIDQGGVHEFFVRDNGIGIAPKNHDEVFGIFKRLESAREFEGTGAGLSIVKGVIEDHGGKIWIDSDLGQGATFRFTIPKNLSIKAS